MYIFFSQINTREPCIGGCEESKGKLFTLITSTSSPVISSNSGGIYRTFDSLARKKYLIIGTNRASYYRSK